MPRSLVLGNGSLLCTFDECVQLRDFSFPHVGQENHTDFSQAHRLGFFVEGLGFSWVNDGSWSITPGYREGTLVTASSLRSERLRLQIICEDTVDPVKNFLLRSLRLRSTDGAARTVRCFFHHNFYLYGDKQRETAFYEPHTKSVIHYRQSRYILIGGSASDPVACAPDSGPDEFHPLLRSEEHIENCGITSFAVGKANYKGLEGTWRDAEDGVLSRCSIEQGSVDSTVELDCLLRSVRESRVFVWVCAGRTITDVHRLQHYILDEKPEELLIAAGNYWRGWARAHDEPGDDMPEAVQKLYWRSLLVIRSQIDNAGGILAGNDNDIMQFNRDSYSYVWPRDGAFVSMALTHAGERESVERFLRFCTQVQSEDGYFLHKYNPDGSPGSSWHPWFRNGHGVLPIQCDETALPILALWKHYQRFTDFEFLHAMYEGFMKKAANFLVRFRDPQTGLPLPSYDLWEEHRGVATFTAGAAYAGLRAAADIATVLGHHRHADRYAEAADRMREGIVYHLFDEPTQSFLKFLKPLDDGSMERITTADSSSTLLWFFDVLPVEDPRVVTTVRRVCKTLQVRTPIGGFARYENDAYQAALYRDPAVPGNPWLIATLWITQWQIASAKTLAELQPCLDTLTWTTTRATDTGMLAEQFHPTTGAPLSVSPLTWSHAIFVETVLRYRDKRRLLLRDLKT